MLLLERAIAFLAPHDCIVCGREGSLLCEACVFEEFVPVPSRCYRCLRVTKDFRACMSCRRSVRLKHVWVAQDYQDYTKRLVRLFKYERAKAAVLPIARQVADTLPYFSRDVIITHIPTATSRQRHRGYDQSELIARSIARLKGLEYARLLERSGQARQVGASRNQRLAQAQQMFRLETKRDIKGSSILVIDDILTTGASLEAAARVLRQAGAKDVSAAVFAQKH